MEEETDTQILILFKREKASGLHICSPRLKTPLIHPLSRCQSNRKRRSDLVPTCSQTPVACLTASV